MKWFTLSFQRGLWLWISGARIHPPWRRSTASGGPVWQEEAAASQVQDTYQGSVDAEGERSCALWVQVASLGWPHHEDWMVQGWGASHSWLVCSVCMCVCVRVSTRVHVCTCVCRCVGMCVHVSVQPPGLSVNHSLSLQEQPSFFTTQKSYCETGYSTYGLSWVLRSSLSWTQLTWKEWECNSKCKRLIHHALMSLLSTCWGSENWMWLVTIEAHATTSSCLFLSGTRYMPAYDFGFVSLDIQWVNSEDSGVYTCRATNDYGEDSTSATVKCRGEKKQIVSHQNLGWF